MASWVLKVDPGFYQTAELIVAGIIPTILLIGGTIGNLLSICILLRKENRRTSTNIYLIFLCLMDTLSLYQWNLNYIVYEYTNGLHDILNHSLFLCKSGLFLSFYTLHTSAMFLTFVELDRASLLRSSWYKRKIAQPRVALAFAAITLAILFALNGFLLDFGATFSAGNSATGTQSTFFVCYYSWNAGLNDYFNYEYGWVHLVVVYFLPFAMMFTCTLFTAKKLFIKPSNDNEQMTRNAQRNRRISLMLLGMCVTYFLTSLPNRLCFSVFLAQLVDHDYTDTLLLATNTLMASRTAINFFFFYISVSGFRRDARNLVVQCRGKFIAGQVAPLLTAADGSTGGIQLAGIRAARSGIETITLQSKGT